MAESWKLKTPGRIQLVGPSHSGKSELVLKLVGDDSIWDTPFAKIMYIAPSLEDKESYLQRLRDRCGPRKILELSDRVPTVPELRDFADGRPVLLILDDLLSLKTDPKELQSLIVMHSHHMEITVVCCVQNPFLSGRSKLDLVTLGRNLTGKILMYQIQDFYVLNTLNARIFPERKRFLIDCLCAAKERYKLPYVFINLHPFSNLDRRHICYTALFEEERSAHEDSPVFFDLEA